MREDSTEKVDSDLQDITFEQAFALLDEVVVALEKGEVALDEATRLYERGMRLAQVCSEIITAADLKITQIQTDYGGQIPFSLDE
tara:strand:- start:246 stop:500 length:255 start_codon:yes stop_codon:yes gene_type:complete